MIRTQIQITDRQIRKLKELASSQRRSMADLIRQAVDRLIEGTSMPNRQDQRRRAMAAAGRFRGTPSDLSEHHDRYLDDSFRS